MRRLLLIAAALLAGSALLASVALADDDDDDDGGRGAKTWRVTVSNLTPAGSQPLSPPLLVVHSGRADVWSVGDLASHGVAAIAEDANNAVLEQALPQVAGVHSVATGPGGPIPPGASRSYTVESRGSHSRLSLLTMLVNTNDAFTGLDSLRLSGRGDVLQTMAYDGGSERNNELRAFIPGPCCGNPFVRDPEGELIRHHPGITGAGELSPAVYGWSGPVARIAVERVS
jgi:hypothetical protein